MTEKILFMLGSGWNNVNLDPGYKWLVVGTYAVLFLTVAFVWGSLS